MQGTPEHVPEHWKGLPVEIEYKGVNKGAEESAPWVVVEDKGTMTETTPLGVVLEGKHFIAYDAITSIRLASEPPERNIIP